MRGPYAPHNPRLPIHGMGQSDVPQVGFADQILLELLGAAPLGVYVAWAEQISDTAWSELSFSEWSYTCVPISQQTLNEVKAAAFGHEVGWVGILFDRPATFNAIERALHGTPYAFDGSLAVYDPAFSGTVPTIRFLVWARLRDSMPGDGGGGGSGSMDAAAQALGGRLVYVIQGTVPPTVRRTPAPFQEVLDAQIGVLPAPTPTQPSPAPTQPSPVPPPVPAVTPAPVPVSPQPSAAAADQSGTLFWILAGGGAAALLLWWYARRKGQAIPQSRRLPARGETGVY